ncbi:hypothetical protein [Microbulbifer sp. VAAF005]|uniref:hypothetical protein n=1 Tax=Microbulbifer sp. VAAF005 TaxID=3034230 RepID=UPI0024AE743A|nr:hypothetical protein [Microbulbifer sp. VAAF005]WHI47322.1 hypothetical protein P0078_02780 [Microbulbifer sp. VAAF005]
MSRILGTPTTESGQKALKNQRKRPPSHNTAASRIDRSKGQKTDVSGGGGSISVSSITVGQEAITSAGEGSRSGGASEESQADGQSSGEGVTTANQSQSGGGASAAASSDDDAQERAVTQSDEGIYLAAEHSKSGFQISQEGAVQIFRKIGLSNIPDALSVDEMGILLADDMLAAAVPAQDLISALEPSPFGKLRTLITGTKIITNGLKTEAKSYWRDTIDDVSLGMGARAGVKYNHELMNRYRELPR